MWYSFSETADQKLTLEHGSYCETCWYIWKRQSPPEVQKVHDDVLKFVCLNCVLAERWIHRKVTGQVTVFRRGRERECASCNGRSSGSESQPWWFCYECFQFLCHDCRQRLHFCSTQQVAI